MVELEVMHRINNRLAFLALYIWGWGLGVLGDRKGVLLFCFSLGKTST